MVRTRSTVARDLDSQERADVRFRCGFGCVRCGATIYVYVRTPGGDEPILLCPSCLELVRAGKLAGDQLAILAASPVLRQPAFSRDHLPFAARVPSICLAGTARPLVDTPVPIRVDGVAPLMFAPPRRGIGATRISLRLGNGRGEPVILIDNNEYMGVRGWDYVWIGHRMSVTAHTGDAALTLRFDSANSITVELLRTRIGKRRLEVTEHALILDSVPVTTPFAQGVLVGLDI